MHIPKKGRPDVSGLRSEAISCLNINTNDFFDSFDINFYHESIRYLLASGLSISIV